MTNYAPMLFVAEAPSNIAFVKYWGKRDASVQWPANDSLSMTLDAARTRTTAQLAPADASTDELTLDGRVRRAGDKGSGKAFAHLAYLRRELGFDAPLIITSRNTFPSDCGIASSASGLAALTLAALGAWTGATSLTALEAAGYPRERLAALARRGSGSACRSLFGGFVRWSAGSSPSTQTCAPLAGEWDLADVIVIVSEAAKAVGSTEAHAAAWTSPLFAPRLAGIAERLALIEMAIARRDLPTLGRELEMEALEMHAVAMSATPPACYVTPQTSEVLAWTRLRRTEGALAAWFTLDAGPNPHLICARADAARIAELVSEAFGYRTLIDRVGSGPTLTAEPLAATAHYDSTHAVPPSLLYTQTAGSAPAAPPKEESPW